MQVHNTSDISAHICHTLNAMLGSDNRTSAVCVVLTHCGSVCKVFMYTHSRTFCTRWHAPVTRAPPTPFTHIHSPSLGRQSHWKSMQLKPLPPWLPAHWLAVRERERERGREWAGGMKQEAEWEWGRGRPRGKLGDDVNDGRRRETAGETCSWTLQVKWRLGPALAWKGKWWIMCVWFSC